MKQRVILFGGSGFVGSHIIQQLDPNQYEAISVTRKDCDFTSDTSRECISKIVQDGDIVVCAAAKAPAKDLDMLTENVALISNIIEAIRNKQIAYVLNVSSDAVYADSMDKLSESSEVAPLSAHGIMHCMREYMLERRINAPIGHIRPTLIYGQADPHNGYGPNSFIRLAQEGKPITLFGQGEERRDHVFVGDVARIALRMIEQKTTGPINAVTGQVISFMDIAKAVQNAADYSLEIQSKPRSGPMPHNGYRAFNNSKAAELCGGAAFQDLTAYIQDVMNEPIPKVIFR